MGLWVWQAACFCLARIFMSVAGLVLIRIEIQIREFSHFGDDEQVNDGNQFSLDW
jgi:hypothetical protein